MQQFHKAKTPSLLSLRDFSFGFILLAGIAVLFCLLWYERCLRWDFNELGRYYAPKTENVYTDSGCVWGLFAALFSGMALVKLLKNIRRRRNGEMGKWAEWDPFLVDIWLKTRGH